MADKKKMKKNLKRKQKSIEGLVVLKGMCLQDIKQGKLQYIPAYLSLCKSLRMLEGKRTVLERLSDVLYDVHETMFLCSISMILCIISLLYTMYGLLFN